LNCEKAASRIRISEIHNLTNKVIAITCPNWAQLTVKSWVFSEQDLKSVVYAVIRPSTNNPSNARATVWKIDPFEAHEALLHQSSMSRSLHPLPSH
jgi:hypothetical protein